MSARLVLFLALLLMPAIALAGIWAEVSATVGDDGISQVRRKVLASALTAAVKTVVERHVPDEELSPHKRKLSAIYKNSAKYIRRHTIEAEGQHLDIYRLSVVAEVDQKSLLSELEELGFEPRRLGAMPRVLSTSYADKESAELAALIAKRFKEEHIPTSYQKVSATFGKAELTRVGKEFVFEVSQTQVEALAKAAFDSSRHIACGVSAVIDTSKEAEDKQAEDKQAVQVDGEDKPLENTEPPEVVVELKVGGYMVDAVSGYLLGNHVVTATGYGPDLKGARKDALGKLGSELYQKFIADLAQTLWAPSGEEDNFEIRVEGVSSPAQIELVAEALKALTELEELSLARVEAGTVVWNAKGIDPGFGWAQIASYAKLTDTKVQWRIVVPPEVETDVSSPAQPTRLLGRTTTQGKPPKVLLGRLATP